MSGTGIHTFLIVVGLLLLLGLATDAIGRRTKLPRVTLLFLFGFLLGPEISNLLPGVTLGWFSLIANIALLLVGFSLGGKMTLSSLRQNGKSVLYISASVVLITVLVVSGGLSLIGVPLSLAILLSGIATATDPAATLDVIEQTSAKGRFTDTLVGVVSIDDAWGLIVFSGLLALVNLLHGGHDGAAFLLMAVWELVGAVVLGVLIGLPMAYMSSRLPAGKTMLLEVVGMVFLCGGLALYFEVSYLLSAMILGVVVANLAEHQERPFYEIEEIEWPFMILFFVLTGASLELQSLSSLWLLVIAYIGLRGLARAVGAMPGAWLANSPTTVKSWIGMALLPQAGVAVGMALIAAAQFPDIADSLIQVVVVATIIFEIVGPIVTRYCLIKVGDAQKDNDNTNTPAKDKSTNIVGDG